MVLFFTQTEEAKITRKQVFHQPRESQFPRILFAFRPEDVVEDDGKAVHHED